MIKRAIVLVRTEPTLDGVPIPLVRIGGVPLIVRLLRDAERAGIEEICFILDRPNAALEEHLRRAGAQVRWRVVTRAEWRREQRTAQKDAVLVLLGDRLYDARLLEVLARAGRNGYQVIIGVGTDLSEASRTADRRYVPNDGKLVEPTSRAADKGGDEVGVYVCMSSVIDLALGVARDDFRPLVHACSNGGVAYFDIGNGFVQPITSRGDIRRAEEKILRYIWKETDGIYARWNKRLVRPLIRWLMRTPVTPNMVSLAGVVVSLVSGYFFSLGSYRSSILGAMLSYVSSLLDHVDGSLARVTARESVFGCWLETVCDYLYYLSLAGGITLGLYRQTGNDLSLLFGGAVFVGTIMSFIVTGYQRKKFTKNPSQLAAQVNRRWEAHAQNPLFRFARTCHFLVRRPVLPYYVFLFAVLKLLPLLLVLLAVGANLVWMVSLWSNRLFRPSSRAS
ncbi:Bifunctional IPC transferase and DIPP synthase [bacterium HR10]|uniref:Bifunctional IPC transferase and DIPP synthase n=1 Tax=uncultured Acidobacteriota bacterium TaxID=171953 RepID=H5SG56_9BACT|nr:hypothetical protein HGMM_F23D12C21 [uncultured Acidobacteriota bacterium]GBC83180.1 Bifunctional IPC transferase and DIPP synthase [bacterium HR10]